MEKTAEQLRREHIALEGDTHGKNKWAILFTVLIMTFMVCLDSTVVTVALPVMQKELGVGLDRIQLVSSVYLLATCVAMLPFGRLGDVRGKVNVFQLGVIVFSVGSLLCGLSASLEVLILARIVQGIGCAAAMANNMGIITESFPARERGRAMGILATFVALGMMCGPVLGGMLVTSFPWESIFLINLPIGVTSFIVGLYTLPHVKPGGRRASHVPDRGCSSLLCKFGLYHQPCLHAHRVRWHWRIRVYSAVLFSGRPWL